ncbi:nuclear transport factor 2 family protein [Nocardioides sp. T2.26MG-1]|uniref:nuclear transport factor 2 family protein n=1 Tax=Nocardioides sp. T2.26MG-1 TaxID=3041166 RepID=UPI0024774158|nr:nuclear transport factor 2 family protein [Nocardioides sp. T2.26MG-1]CAI9402888.1 hypothetical protein HIDPHFAB_00909 [Nocardioides sp. T2.26MG-1]
MSKLSEAEAAARITAYLQNYPREVIAADHPEEVLDRYHTPDYAVITDGITLDRERLLAHVTPARRRASDARVEVHDVICAGDRFAARYTLEATMRKGGVISTEIHVLGELADDGRVCRARQLTRDVTTRDRSAGS